MELFGIFNILYYKVVIYNINNCVLIINGLLNYLN